HAAPPVDRDTAATAPLKIIPACHLRSIPSVLLSSPPLSLLPLPSSRSSPPSIYLLSPLPAIARGGTLPSPKQLHSPPHQAAGRSQLGSSSGGASPSPRARVGIVSTNLRCCATYGMRLRIAGDKTAASDPNPAASVAAAADGAGPAPFAAAASGAVVTAVAGPAGYHSGTENGSKDESFFEARPWLDSDSEDDFYSVKGDFTPSRSSTPDHPRLITSFSGRVPVDRSKHSLIQKKQRLLDLLQEKQHYDDDDDNTTDDSSDLENGAVHAEEHMKTSLKGKKSKKSSRSGCFPSLIWSRKKRKEQKDKVN
ncbi:unnamed protein product, partial [Urochloa humidicola]